MRNPARIRKCPLWLPLVAWGLVLAPATSRAQELDYAPIQADHLGAGFDHAADFSVDLADTLVEELGMVDQQTGILIDPFYPPMEACPEYDAPNVAWYRNWYVEAGPAGYARERTRFTTTSFTRFPILIGNTIIFINEPRLGTQHLETDVEPGLRLTVGRHLGRDVLEREHMMEFTLLKPGAWDSEVGFAAGNIVGIRDGTGAPDGTVFEVGDLLSRFGIFVAGFSNVQLHEQFYSSRLSSFEWNYRIRSTYRDRLVAARDGKWIPRGTSGIRKSMLLGARYFSLNERYHLASRGVIIDDVGGTDTVNQVRGDYRVETKNDLIGLHVGGELFQENTYWSYGVNGKVGLFANFAEQSTVIETRDQSLFHANDPRPDRTGSDSGSNAAFVGEIGLMLSWRPAPRLTIRGRYDFTWMVGLALAPEQITFSPIPLLLNDGGNMLLQTVSVTGEFIW